MKQKSILPVLLVLVVVALASHEQFRMTTSFFTCLYFASYQSKCMAHCLIYLFRNLYIVSVLQTTHNSTVLYQLQ